MSHNGSAFANAAFSIDPDGKHLYDIRYGNIQTSIAISFLELIGASILATFFTQRVRLEDLKSLQGLRRISLPRLYLALLFFTSWLFFLVSAVLIQGIGLNLGRKACDSAIMSGVILYSGSKIFVYLFLGERVHIVWSPTMATPRYKSPLYMLSLIMVIAYFGVVLHLVFVHIVRFNSAGLCIIGLKLHGIILLLVFDVIISVTMTSLFICPLLRNTFHHSHLRDMAKRSVIAAFITLAVSCVNISILAAAGGTSVGGILLACWEGDVLVSAAVLFWLTSGSGMRPVSIPAAVRSSSPRRRSGSSWLRRTSTNWSAFFNGDAKRQSTTLPTSMLDALPQDAVRVSVPETALTTEEKRDEASGPVAADSRPPTVDVVLARRPVLQRAPPSDYLITVIPVNADSGSVEVTGSVLERQTAALREEAQKERHSLSARDRPEGESELETRGIVRDTW